MCPWSEDRTLSIISIYRDRPGALLSMLHGLMEEFGCIDEAAILLPAGSLNISRAEAVSGIAGHIRDFWDPCMRTQLQTHVSTGGEGLSPLVIEAAGQPGTESA